MTSSSRWVLSLALCVVTTAPHRTVLAQSSVPSAQELETARSLYKQGKELRARGDLRGALEKFQAAHALGNTPVTGIELARTYVLVGQIVEAREVSLYIARMPVASDETSKSVEARTEAAKLADDLKARIPTLVVKVSALRPGESAHVSIDGAPVPDAAMTEPQKVNPGKHTVVVRAGERRVEATSEVAEGQAAEIALTLPELAPLPPPATATPTPTPTPTPTATATATATPTSTSPSPLIRIGFSVAGVSVAFGVLSGIVALSKRNQLNSACNSNQQCDSAHGGAGDLSTAYSWATVSTVSFAVAGAGVVLGVAGLLANSAPAGQATQGGARLTPWIGPGAAGIHGQF